jgi:hypothetical protein
VLCETFARKALQPTALHKKNPFFCWKKIISSNLLQNDVVILRLDLQLS